MQSDKTNFGTGLSSGAYRKRKVLIWLLTVLIVFNSCAPMVEAGDFAPKVMPISQPPSAMPSKVTKGACKVTIFKPSLTFSKSPTDQELEMANVFREPIVPLSGSPVKGENAALAKALVAFKGKTNPEDISDFKVFIAKYADSRWRASLELNLGTLSFEMGHINEALSYWQSAWEKAKDEKSAVLEAVANEALANLVHLQASLGKKAELEENLKKFDKRNLYGSSELKVREAKQGLACMNKHPEIAYKCGPYALNSILNINKKSKGISKLIVEIKSTEKGTNLAQLKDWAEQSGLSYQMAKRTAGARIITPAIMHWQVGHFAAVTDYKNGRYHLKDPTFGQRGNFWVKVDVLDKETDGYFLIPEGQLPEGWQAVSVGEGETVWGKGVSEATDQSKTPTNPQQCMGTNCCSSTQGMAQASAFLTQATLKIQDIPLSYSPPIGPSVDFLVNYNYLEGEQPTSFTFTNLGADWSLNWLSYLTIDGSSNVTVRVRGGGYELFNYPYVPNLTSQAIISNPSSGVWNRQLPDGTVEVFNQADTSGRIFMTQVTDPQGNSAYIQYDSNFRLTTVTDAIGQVSTITYVSNTLGAAGFYKIAKITDPFGRLCTFNYDSSTTFLTSITDVVNLVSQFTNDTSSSFITTMTTPYGTTSFYQYAGFGEQTGLRFAFPDGTNSVIENWIGYPVQTYFWDRETLMLYPSDPTAFNHTNCVITQFLLMNDTPHTEVPVIDYVVPPLENRTTYGYAGEIPYEGGSYNFVGPSNRPIAITRNTATSGTTNQVWQYTYNILGYPTEAIDPVGRTFTYTYAANNIDLLQKAQTKGTNSDLNGKWTSYNSQHLPATYIDGSGQTTSYTYNTFGELKTLTDPGSNVWTWTYNTNGYLTQLDGPLPGSNDITTFTYDGYGRLYTVTDSEGYVLTYSYDNANRLTQVTYPDGTYEQIVYDKLDAVMKKDRIGRWTQDNYDSMDQLAFEIDPLSRKTQYTWCACGSLGALTDPVGHTTSWQHDVEGRLVTKTYPDSSILSYTYDIVGRVHTRLDALNQTATYTYNLDNTLSQTAYTNAVNPTSTVNLTYDPNYPRLSTAQNGWGTITDSYNPYVLTTFTTPVTGGGRLSGVTNNVITNSAIAYTYDAIGRTTNRSINTTSNSTTWTYDAMSRITAESNPLGSFAYHYVDDTTGSSKGTTRLSSINYPNSQTTNFSWYNNVGDQRLQQINNLNPGGSILSRYIYTYDAASEITTTLQQQFGNNSYYNYNNYSYDLAGQLSSAQESSGIPVGPPYTSQNYYNYDLASNRTVFQRSTIQTVRLGGSVTTGNQVSVTVLDNGLSGGSKTISYTVVSGDTLTSIASQLAAAITMDANMQSIGVNATASNTVISLQSVSSNITTYTPSTSGGATETATLGIVNNGTENAIIGGTKTTGDVITITVVDAGLTGGTKAINYTVLAADTLTTIATGLAAAINADTSLQGIKVTATSAGTVVSIKSNSSNITTYTSSLSVGATETIKLAINTNGIQTAAIGGTKTTGNILTITVYDAGLTGGTKIINYTVLAADTLPTIAAGLAAAINADTSLQAIGVTASATAQVVNIKSTSLNKTGYVKTVSGGGTETITLGLNTFIQTSAYNNVNELTGIVAGGAARVQGTTNKAVKSVKINGTNPATLNWSESFTGNGAISPGINVTTVTAVDGGNNSVTGIYLESANTRANQTFTNDANGNMTSDGTNTYAWDAENRLIQKTYPGTNNYSQFIYDALGNCVKIVETVAGTITSTKQFVVCGSKKCEARDATSTITAQYFPQGETISGTSYYYTKDYLGSITGVTNGSGVIQALYSYDAYGQATKLQGSLNSDFQYSGYYYHAPSGLNLTVNRAYNANLGRWINRDPIGEAGGVNLYAYVDNSPLDQTDPSGLFTICQPKLNLTPLPLSDPDLFYPSLFPNDQGRAEPDPLLTDILLPPVAGRILGRLIPTAIRVAGPLRATINLGSGKPVGRLGNPIYVVPGYNRATTINGIKYVNHAIDQMQGRGIPPSVVEDAIKYGQQFPGGGGRLGFYSPINNVRVITETTGKVVTVIPGSP